MFRFWFKCIENKIKFLPTPGESPLVESADPATSHGYQILKEFLGSNNK